MALRPGPHAAVHSVWASLPQQIAVSITHEPARAGAECEKSAVALVLWGLFEFANIGLVVRQAHVLRPGLGRNGNGHSRSERNINHLLVEPLCVQIDFNPSSACGYSLEDGFPEGVAWFRNTAFAVNTKYHAADRRTLLENRPQSIAAIRGVIFRCQPADGVVGVRAVGPLIRVRPQPELKIEPSLRGRVRSEAQHLKIAVAFGVRQSYGAHIISGNRHQEWIGEVKVCVGDVAREIVSETESQRETIEALPRQHRQVLFPEGAVVEPRLVFHIALKAPADRAYLVGRRFRYSSLDADTLQHIVRRTFDKIRKLQ